MGDTPLPDIDPGFPLCDFPVLTFKRVRLRNAFGLLQSYHKGPTQKGSTPKWHPPTGLYSLARKSEFEDIQRWGSMLPLNTLDTRHSTLDTRHSTLDTRHSTLDTHTHTESIMICPGCLAFSGLDHFGARLFGFVQMSGDEIGYLYFPFRRQMKSRANAISGMGAPLSGCPLPNLISFL